LGCVSGPFESRGVDYLRWASDPFWLETRTGVGTTFSIEDDETVRCIFWGLGSDGTVGANKNSIKIIGEGTNNYAQGYFVYDSKKSGSVTISHLRFGPHSIQAPYLIDQANFVACHQFSFLERLDVLKQAKYGGIFLLNCAFGPDEVWPRLPVEVQRTILEKRLRFYVIDADRVARETGMGGRVNTIMQTCFFAISGVLPRDEAIEAIKQSIKKTYGKRGEAVVQRNFQAVDQTLAHLCEVNVAAAQAEAQAAIPPANGAAKSQSMVGVPLPVWPPSLKVMVTVRLVPRLSVVLLKLMGEATSTDIVTVRIGRENPYAELQSTSLVASGYGTAVDSWATLGIVGPTRMDYPSTIASVRAVARYVGRFLAEG